MGGPSNPPDKPYVVLTLAENDDQATAQLQDARAAGFEVLFAVPFDIYWSNSFKSGTRVILGNYKTDGKKS